jgi:glycosyltransferase involved in cell wall biosynthesis
MKNNPLRVLVVSSKYPPEYAGSGFRAHRTYQRLQQRCEMQWRVLCGSTSLSSSGETKYEGVSVYRVPNYFRWLRASPLKSLRVLGRILNFYRQALHTWLHLIKWRCTWDVMHLFGSDPVTASALLWAQIFNRPTIVELVTEMPHPYPYLPFPLKLFFSTKRFKQTQIIVISERLRRLCEEYGIQERVWCRPNPIDESRFFPEPNRKTYYRKVYTPYQDNDVVLLNVGKFIPIKNQIFLVEAMRHLPENYRLLLMGPFTEGGPEYKRDTAYMENIRSRIESYHLSHRVRIQIGFVQMIDHFLKLSDLYLFPSITEGLGTPILESTACSTPVVATEIAGITDRWIEDGVNGFSVTRDPEIFANAIQKAVQIPLATRLAAAERILSVAGYRVIDPQYQNLIQSTVGQTIYA